MLADIPTTPSIFHFDIYTGLYHNTMTNWHIYRNLHSEVPVMKELT